MSDPGYLTLPMYDLDDPGSANLQPGSSPSLSLQLSWETSGRVTNEDPAS